MWSNNKTKLVVIKSTTDSGKTTTLWMLLFELVNQGAKLINLYHVGNHEAFQLPANIPGRKERFDFIAELKWHERCIMILSHGDYNSVVQAELDALLNKEPDFIVCASRSQNREGSTWGLFENTYTNIYFQRVCFWSEYAAHELDELDVKKPTIEAIVKYIKP